MNRAEYRRLKREERKKKVVRVMNEEQYDIECKNRDLSTMNSTTLSNLGLYCLALHDTFGFGHDRLKKVVDNFMLKYSCVVEDVEDHGLSQSEKFDFLAVIRQVNKETGLDLTKYFERDVFGNVRLREEKE